MVARRQHPVALLESSVSDRRSDIDGKRIEVNLEIIQPTVITSRFSPPPFPLRLSGHVHLRVWDANGELTVVGRRGSTRVRATRRVGHEHWSI
jgi:hypothetical protein